VFQLTSRGNYGILAVYYIARQRRNEFISIDEIAENSKIPKPYLSKILQNLSRGGILLSRRGTGGGFALSRPPCDINLREIIEVIEGKIYFVNCLLTASLCDNSQVCPISPMWQHLQNFIMEIIASVTVADIIDDAQKQNMFGLLQSGRASYHEKIQDFRATCANTPSLRREGHVMVSRGCGDV